MALPGDLLTVTVTGRFTDASGALLRGKITFTPSVVLTDAAGATVIDGTRTCYLSAGAFTSPPLVATDNAGIAQDGWLYEVEVALENAQPVTYSFPIPHEPSPADISALIAAAG